MLLLESQAEGGMLYMKRDDQKYKKSKVLPSRSCASRLDARQEL